MFGIISKAVKFAVVTGYTGSRIVSSGGVAGAVKSFFEDFKTVGLLPWTAWQSTTQAGVNYRQCLDTAKSLQKDWLFSPVAPMYGTWCEASRMQSIVAAVSGVYVTYKMASYGLGVVQTGKKCYQGYKKINALRKQVFQALSWVARKGQPLLQKMGYKNSSSAIREEITQLGKKRMIAAAIDVHTIVTSAWEKGMELYKKAHDKSSTAILPLEQLKSLLALCQPVFQHMEIKEDGLLHVGVASRVNLEQLLEKFPSLTKGQQEIIQVMGPQIVLDILPPPVCKELSKDAVELVHGKESEGC